jgi:6-phosphogluconolactonase/glucosamine-6-phosphate isomerase/deaminase
MTQVGSEEITASILGGGLQPSQCETMSLMITGGRGAKQLYKKWREDDVFRNIARPLDLFITDERCVSHDHSDSNYRMIDDVLFRGKPPRNVIFHHMAGAALDLDVEADRYGQLLPDSVEILLLSMGEDGHIASLFPNSSALVETKRKVVPIEGPKEPFKRLTITPPVIQAAKQVYVLAIGDEKRRKYEEALLDPKDISSIPARLVLDRTWIFDLNEEIDLCLKL